jgi:hypothetical protein
MAETKDRSHDLAEAPTELSSPSSTYRPLSLLALGGFGLAVAFTLIVAAGGAINLFGRTPFLLPAWSFLLPIAALVVCWAAKMRIRASEDTLSGTAFTTWGLRLTIVVGLTYAAYYAATFFAVRGSAVEWVDGFFEQIKQGNLERAFALSSGIGLKDMDSKELRNTVEGRFNNPMGQNPGPFTQFRQSQFVRFIQMGGPKTNIERLGVTGWNYEKGGYRIVLRYRVATTLGEFEMQLTAFGADPKPGEAKGRQWQIRLAKDNTTVIKETMTWTPHGENARDWSMSAGEFARTWSDKLSANRLGEAYLDTLPLDERQRLRQGQATARLLAAAPLTGAASLGLCDAVCREYLSGAEKLKESKLIRIDLGHFWASKNQAKSILDRIEKTFQPSGGRLTFNLAIQPNLPSIHESEGKVSMAFDVILRYMAEDSPSPQYMVEGQLVVEGLVDGQAPTGWRVAALELDSGRTPPSMPAQQPPSMPMEGGIP